MATKNVKRSGSHRMRQLGKVQITIWVTTEQRERIEEAAGVLAEKTAGFVRQAALNRVTDVRRRFFSS